MSMFIAFHVKDLIKEILNNDDLTFEWTNDDDDDDFRVTVSSGVHTFVFDAEYFTRGWGNLEDMTKAIQGKINEIREWYNNVCICYNRLKTDKIEFTFK